MDGDRSTIPPCWTTLKPQLANLQLGTVAHTFDTIATSTRSFSTNLLRCTTRPRTKDVRVEFHTSMESR